MRRHEKIRILKASPKIASLEVTDTLDEGCQMVLLLQTPANIHFLHGGIDATA
jgi:hypothetical protein